MMIHIDMKNVRLDERDILTHLKNTFGLGTECDEWYEKDGVIYHDDYRNYTHIVTLSETQRKAYEVYKQIEELYKLQRAEKNKQSN